jgi:hypothetical protein
LIEISPPLPGSGGECLFISTGEMIMPSRKENFKSENTVDSCRFFRCLICGQQVNVEEVVSEKYNPEYVVFCSCGLSFAPGASSKHELQGLWNQGLIRDVELPVTPVARNFYILALIGMFFSLSAIFVVPYLRDELRSGCVDSVQDTFHLQSDSAERVCSELKFGCSLPLLYSSFSSIDITRRGSCSADVVEWFGLSAESAADICSSQPEK